MHPSSIYDSALLHTAYPGAVERRCYQIGIEGQQQVGGSYPFEVERLSGSAGVHEGTVKKLIVAISHARILAGQAGGARERYMDRK